ncbi:MAG: hypothetical protein A2103_01820 [Gammaproteobacteria bacterium GWF2_41_13]|nr:MAG: hypothetical protein A2103_01820 [Gammaproteobacteria bacterium GWF2_41_13]
MVEREGPNYFRIGSFVIVAIILVIMGLILFGSGKVFQKTIYVETYFNESVQGLSEGSPVKYRGVQIGYVKRIGLISEIYSVHNGEAGDLYGRYVYVLIAINKPVLTQTPQSTLGSAIEQDVQKGLRVQLAPQGLTGTAYLELNFINPQESKAVQINWQPNHYYIPATTSTLGRFADNAQYILDELKQVDVKKLFATLQNVLESTNHFVRQTDDLFNRSGQPIQTTLDNLREISENLKAISDQAKIYPPSVLFGRPPAALNPRNL